MKKLINFTLMILTITVLSITSNYGQVAPEGSLKIEAGAGGLALVGANSDNTKTGPYLGGTLAYGIGQGITIFAESGYGYSDYKAVNKLSLVQVPVLVGATYNFSELLNSDMVQPYAGISAGVTNYLLQLDWNTVSANGYEQKSTNFTLEGIMGVNFQVTPDLGINVSGKYNHGFKKDRGPGTG